ncbi:MAG: glycoside hydrolase family 25 protein [Lachnospiraceae bacterium]|nr:glycoside hydrolase family 25 protein [Lachnospiraceae bacterium]
MERRRDKGLIAVVIIMSFVTLVSLGLVVLIGFMWYQNSGELEVTTTEEIEVVEEPVVEVMNVLTEEERTQVTEEARAAFKEEMKSFLTIENPSTVRMIRNFFPENLVFYDDKSYVFAPIQDSLKKHGLNHANLVENEKGEMEYIENGVVTSHKGIDVSKYQGNIDWQAVKEDGVEYAFIRLGLRGYESGKVVLDEYFKKNMRGANEAGVKAGVYFFTQAITEEEAIEEAEFVIENLADYDVPYPVVMDVEMITSGDGRANNLSMEERTKICIAFCETIKNAGYTPMIYGNIKCFVRMLDMAQLEDYEKWYAFYDNYLYFPYDVSVWQYSESGSVNGIKGDVDMNISFKTW